MHSLLVLLLMALPPLGGGVVSVSVSSDQPVIITRPGHTVAVHADRVTIQYDGMPRGVTVLLGDADGPLPPPPPPPPPQPDPSPAPVVGHVWAVLILPDQPTPEQSSLRTNDKIRKALAERDMDWRSYLVTEAEVQAPGYQPIVAGGLPVVVWIATGGKVVDTSRPVIPDGVIGRARALRGK